MRIVVRRSLAWMLLLAASALAEPTSRPTSQPIADFEATPASLDELRVLQGRVQRTLADVLPTVVALQVGNAQGSGVIVTSDGLILTAGHVVGDSGRRCTVTLSDGRRVRGVTLGSNRTLDSGMVKIIDSGEYPAAVMGRSGTLLRGQWAMAMGHPGGYRVDRPAVLRLGRVQFVDNRTVVSDNTLVGGDSGGPLFDIDGKVVGIHSRIGTSTQNNVHVPVDTFYDTWDRLLSGDRWGTPLGERQRRRGPMPRGRRE